MKPELERNNEPLFKYINFDEAAFETFFKENFVSLCSYCQVKFGFDVDLAKEVVHIGFIKLWENRQSLSGDLSIRAYLLKIISNTCVDTLRHRKVRLRHEKYVLNHAATGVENSADNRDYKCLAADIEKAVSELPEQMRVIFKLSRYEGLKYAAIAAQLSISVKTVETQMSRALMKLRQKLFNYLPVYLFVFVTI